MERLRVFEYRRVPAARGLDRPGQIKIKMGVVSGRVLRIYPDMSHLPLGRTGPNADYRCKRDRLAAAPESLLARPPQVPHGSNRPAAFPFHLPRVFRYT